MALDDKQQDDVAMRVEGTALAVSGMLPLISEIYRRIRGEKPNVDMLQDILGQVGGEVPEVHLTDEQAAMIANATVSGLSTLLASNRDALLAEIRQLPAEVIAELRAALA